MIGGNSADLRRVGKGGGGPPLPVKSMTYDPPHSGNFFAPRLAPRFRFHTCA